MASCEKNSFLNIFDIELKYSNFFSLKKLLGLLRKLTIF